MKLTKFKHACLVLEKDGATLVVDPGGYSHDFIIPKRVDGIIITHEHPDHLDPTLVGKILKANPKAIIIGHESITSKFADSPTQAVTPGQIYPLGPFTLQFFGGTHAPITESMPVPPNLGVLVDNYLYYPGDSFTIPENITIDTLALPVAAPWLKFDMAAKYLEEVHPRFAFPTHDQILSDDGQQMIDRMVGGVANSKGILYKRLDGTTTDLA